MNEFSQETAEAIRSYVYALLDSRRRTFYVGKGRGQRCFQHARAAIKYRKSSDEPNPKLEFIRDLHRKTGEWPRIEIIRHELNDDEARLLEAILIKAFRTDYNLAAGLNANNFCLSTEDVEGIHSDPLPESELGSSVLLVSLNGSKKDGLNPFPDIRKRELPRRVLRYWRMAREKAAIVDYIAGVYRQVVRIVFEV